MSIDEDYDDTFLVPILSYDPRTKTYVTREPPVEMMKHYLRSLLSEDDIEDVMLLIRTKGNHPVQVARPVIFNEDLLKYTCEYIHEMNRVVDILSNQFIVTDKVQ